MKGQWIGNYSGSNNGRVIVNIDERSSCFEGVAYIHDCDPNLPGIIISFRTQNKNAAFQFSPIRIMAINPITGFSDEWNNVKNNFSKEVLFPEHVDVTGSWSGNELTLSWRTNINTHGCCVLPSSRADQPSEIIPTIIDWNEFRESLSFLKGPGFIFRGQNEPWRLRTSFHRAERFNLERFVLEDIQKLHKHLSARTKHVFNLEIPNENGGFLNLVQHHGYPTPLLDWTYSPYVAAFFAYRGISSNIAAKSKPDEKVRIYAFNLEAWSSKPQILNLLFSNLHISIGDFIAVENERMIPQQAVSLISNVDDVEAYINTCQTDNNKCLFAFDLPVQDRDQVVKELEYMGVTAGSLFPGLDGACEELKERNFQF